MGTWGLPAAAAAFWAGLLAWDTRPIAIRGLPWGWWLGLGLLGMAGAWFAAPRATRDDPLEVSGLAAEAHPAVGAVAAPRVRDRRAGGAVALLLLVLGTVLAGVGWGGFAEARRQGAYLASVTGAVEVVGTLREDPSPGPYGWHTYLDVVQAGPASGSLSGGRVALRETVWLDADGDPPAATRGDLVRAIGVIQIPDDPGFAQALRHRGVAVSLRSDQVERLGPAPNPFVHATQVIRVFVGRTIERIFPPREAGLLLGLVLGDASKLDAVTARDFQTTGLGHLLVVSGENVAMVLAPSPGTRLSSSEPVGSRARSASSGVERPVR